MSPEPHRVFGLLSTDRVTHLSAVAMQLTGQCEQFEIFAFENRWCLFVRLDICSGSVSLGFSGSRFAGVCGYFGVLRSTVPWDISQPVFAFCPAQPSLYIQHTEKGIYYWQKDFLLICTQRLPVAAMAQEDQLKAGLCPEHFL